jgi:hypothetical protein
MFQILSPPPRVAITRNRSTRIQHASANAVAEAMQAVFFRKKNSPSMSDVADLLHRSNFVATPADVPVPTLSLVLHVTRFVNIITHCPDVQSHSQHRNII